MTDAKAPKLILPKSAKRPLSGLCKVELNEFYVCPKCMVQHSPGVLGTVEITFEWGAVTTYKDYKHAAVLTARTHRANHTNMTVRWNGEIV